MLESHWHEFLTFLVIAFIAMASPGPDFAICLRHSLKHGKYAGIMSAIGISLGILLHATYTLLGFGLIIAQSVVVFTIFKVIGAFYLIYIGFKALRTPKDETQHESQKQESQASLKSSFYAGFITNALNPKVTLTFLSLFTLVVSPSTPIHVQILYASCMALMSLLWFSLLSLIFTSKPIHKLFKKVSHWVERGAGAFFIAIGIRLIFTKAPNI